MFTGPSPLRRALVGVAFIPLIPVVIGLMIGSGSAGAGAAVSEPSTLRAAPLGPTAPGAGPALPAGGGTVVGVIRHATALYAMPHGRTIAHLGPRSEFGGPQALWVVSTRGAWLGVLTPQAGNGRVAWIPSRVAALSRIDYRIRVSLAARRLVVTQAGHVLKRYTVAIGRPSAPTPTGRFAVTDRLLTGDPGGPYGCCILALSARAPHTIQGWSGGDRIAIHSTPETASIGQPVSHGCLRLTLAEGRWLLAHVPLGTPVLISST